MPERRCSIHEKIVTQKVYLSFSGSFCSHRRRRHSNVGATVKSLEIKGSRDSTEIAKSILKENHHLYWSITRKQLHFLGVFAVKRHVLCSMLSDA